MPDSFIDIIPRRCSFCGESEDDVVKLIAGRMPGSHICDVCVAKATGLLDRSDGVSDHLISKRLPFILRGVMRVVK